MTSYTLEILKGLNIEQKRAIAGATCDIATKFFNIPQHEVFLRISEVDFEDYSRNGELSGPAPRIYVVYEGSYSQESLRGFIADVAEKVSEIIELAKKDIHIILVKIEKSELLKGGTGCL